MKILSFFLSITFKILEIWLLLSISGREERVEVTHQNEWFTCSQVPIGFEKVSGISQGGKHS